MNNPQTKECSPMLLEVRNRILMHEEASKDPRRTQVFRDNEVFIAVGLREAEQIIMKYEFKD